MIFIYFFTFFREIEWRLEIAEEAGYRVIVVVASLSSLEGLRRWILFFLGGVVLFFTPNNMTQKYFYMWLIKKKIFFEL